MAMDAMKLQNLITNGYDTTNSGLITVILVDGAVCINTSE